MTSSAAKAVFWTETQKARCIRVSSVIFASQANFDRGFRGVVLHELAHIIAGLEARHGAQWRAVCEKLGGITSTTHDLETFGLDEDVTSEPSSSSSSSSSSHSSTSGRARPIRASATDIGSASRPIKKPTTAAAGAGVVAGAAARKRRPRKLADSSDDDSGSASESSSSSSESDSESDGVYVAPRRATRSRPGKVVKATRRDAGGGAAAGSRSSSSGFNAADLISQIIRF